MRFAVSVIAVLLFYFSLQSSFAQGTENVRKSTKDAVEALRTEFPNFKLSSDAQQCLDDKIVDPDCDGLVGDETRVYRKKQQLDAKSQQLEIVEKANQGIEIVIGLIQLGMYVDYGKVPNPQGNFMEKVQKNQDTPKEVIELFVEMQTSHDSLKSKPNNSSGLKIIELASHYLKESLLLQQKITAAKFKSILSESAQNARTMLDDYRRLKERSAPK